VPHSGAREAAKKLCSRVFGVELPFTGMRNQISTQWVLIEAIQADDVLFDQDSQSSWPVLSCQPHPAQHWRRLVSGEPGSGRCLDAPIGTWVRRVLQ